MIVDLVSFSFNQDLPEDVNYIIDVRFLNNPFYVDGLKDLTGLDEHVIDFFKKDKKTQSFLDELINWIKYLIDINKKANKTKIIIAIGCTGGRHRSPYIVESLGKALTQMKAISELSIYHKGLRKYNVSITNRG